jgi:arginine deiminase
MHAIRVFSEIDPLRRVMLHRPGREIDWMPPSMMEQLLFDDILYGEEAREEHAQFQAVFERAGVEVVDAQELLAEALETGDARDELLGELHEEYGVDRSVIERLEDLDDAEMAEALVCGIRADSPRFVRSGGSEARRKFFDLPPLPNYFFQRDPQVVVGDRVMISSMATAAREREPLLARTLFRHHPDFGAAGASLFEIDQPLLPSKTAPGHAPTSQVPAVEGGDVLVASSEIVLVGLSERTNRRGIEVLAEYLRSEETGFRHLIMVELPPRRSYMHLDTVFTLIDRDSCLAYTPVIESGAPESAPAYYVDLDARELTFAVRPSLLAALAGLGFDLDVVPCGGPSDLVEQQREQWTDGANAFALAPGVILLYRRNRRTVDELARRGWRVLSEQDVIEGGAPVLGHGRTVVTLAGNELSRARGGPRCMTAPLEREAG